MTVAPTVDRARRDVRFGLPASEWGWLAFGVVVAFGIPFVFADLLDVSRDLYYGVYMASVAAFVATWARRSELDVRALVRRRWRWAVVLGALCAAVLSFMVVRTETATRHPHGLELAAALVWRGLLYGATDGVLLSAFPILAVFCAFKGRPLLRRLRGKLAVGALALAASLAFTAVYHLGYPEFRGDMLRKPVAGDLVWSVPTLVTLNPVGSPIAHAGMHVSAVLHSYDTETFLPPHGDP
jgi:hypothetical protein